MANLPWELVEEILSRVPPLSLTRFRAVCKQWNSLIDDNKFVKYQLVQSRPQFIFQIDDNIYSVAVNFSGDLGIEVSDITLESPCHLVPDELNKKVKLWSYVDCDGLLFCFIARHELLIWNPWLRETIKIQILEGYIPAYAIGYDNKKKRYKLCEPLSEKTTHIYEIGLLPRKLLQDLYWSADDDVRSNVLSLSGILYWVAAIDHHHVSSNNNNSIFIRKFSFSTERVTTFCRVPPKTYQYDDDKVLSLSGFKKNRLSLLSLCYKSSNITVWLTKNNIMEETGDEEVVVWTKLITVLIPADFPKIPKVSTRYYLFNRPDLTYFLDNEDAKRLVICCYDTTDDHAYIYIVRGVIFKKIKLDDYAPLHHLGILPKLHAHIPSLVRPSWVNNKKNYNT